MTSLERIPGKLVLGIYLILVGLVSIFHLEIVAALVSIAGAVAGMLLIQEAAPPPGGVVAPEALKNIGKVQSDDLTRIAGITPAVSDVLNSVNIKTYTTLGKTKPETLKKILKKAGSGIEAIDPSGWPRQARLANQGRWNEMEPIQSIENSQEEKLP